MIEIHPLGVISEVEPGSDLVAILSEALLAAGLSVGGADERHRDRPIGCIRNRRCSFCDSVVTDRSQSRSRPHGRKRWEPKRVTSRRM
jgi:hypothetical protein